MEIKTKFNLGDTVWIIRGSKATKITIEAIAVNKNGIFYSDCPLVVDIRPESQCFATKEELVDYILASDE